MTNEELEQAFTEKCKEDLDGALMLITGLFVGINIAFCEIQGDPGDGDKQITINGGPGSRIIKIYKKGYELPDEDSE